MSSVLETFMSLFITSTTRYYFKPTCGCRKEPGKAKLKKQSEDTMIKDVRNLFKLKKKMK